MIQSIKFQNEAHKFPTASTFAYPFKQRYNKFNLRGMEQNTQRRRININFDTSFVTSDNDTDYDKQRVLYS